MPIRPAPKLCSKAVPSEARRDAGYIFSRSSGCGRQDQLADAAQLMLAAPRDPDVLRNTDEWWVERRLIAAAA